MIKKNLLLLTLVPFLLVGCGKDKASSEGGKEESSEHSSGEDSSSELPNAPVDEITLSLSNFTRLEALPAPSITGLTAENVQVAYSYHNHETGARIGDYVAGAAAGSIELGQYKLKAAVTSSTYKPFELSADFSVVKAAFPAMHMTAHDYSYDETKPAPDFYYDEDSSEVEFPEGTVITYKYYVVAEEKFDYVPGTANDIDHGNYTLEATITHPDYLSIVLDYDFVVSQINPYSASTGYRIVIGDYVGAAHDTVPHIDRSFFAEPASLHFDFRDQSEYAWTMFPLATFAVAESDSSTAHIDNVTGKLVVDDLSAESFTIYVRSSNPNYYMQTNIDVHLVDAQSTNRSLDFSYDESFATYYGLDKTTVAMVGNGEKGKGNGYVAKLNHNGSGFYLDSKFKAIKSVSVKFRLNELTGGTSFNLKVAASTHNDWGNYGDDVTISHNVTIEGYEETFVEYDFSESVFDAEKVYFLTFWLGNINNADGVVKIRELQIVYDAADFVPAE